MRSDIAKHTAKLLYPAWRMRSFYGGGGKCFLRNWTSKNSIAPVSRSLYHVSLLWAIPEWTFSWQRIPPPPPPLFLFSGWEYWRKWPLSDNQLIFIQGRGMRGMHWCADTNKCSVCAREAWYEKEWTLITKATPRTTAPAHTCIT